MTTYLSYSDGLLVNATPVARAADASTTWTVSYAAWMAAAIEMPLIGSISVTAPYDTVDVATKSDIRNGWAATRRQVPGAISLSFDSLMQDEDVDSNPAIGTAGWLLHNYARTNNYLSAMVFSQAESGVKTGWAGNFQVQAMSTASPVDGVTVISFQFTPFSNVRYISN